MKGKVADMADFFVGSEYHRPWSEGSPAWHQKKQFWESKTLWAGKYSRKCTSRVHRPLWVGSLVAFKLPHEYNFNRIGTVIGNTARRWGHVVRIVETNPYDPNDFQVHQELDFTVYPRERYWRPGNRCFVRQNVPRELYGSDQKYAIAMEMNAELDGVPMVVVDSSDSVADGDMPRYHVGARRADGQGGVLYFKEYELYNGGRLPHPASWVSRSSSSSSAAASSSSAAASSSSAAASSSSAAASSSSAAASSSSAAASSSSAAAADSSAPIVKFEKGKFYHVIGAYSSYYQWWEVYHREGNSICFRSAGGGKLVVRTREAKIDEHLCEYVVFDEVRKQNIWSTSGVSVPPAASSSSSSSSAAASSSSAAAVPDIEYAGGASLQDRLDAGKESAVYVDSDLDTDEDSDEDDVMIIDPPPGPPPGPSPGPPPGPPSGPGAPPPSVAPFGMALHKMFKALRF